MAIGDQVPSKTLGARKAGVTYVDRLAVRVITFNGAGEVAIIHAKRDNYFKLPGGGIDPDEDHEAAVQREMQEETGCVIKLRDSGCIATTEEYRNDLHQRSYCYCADLVDDSGKPTLTDEEVLDKLGHLWVPVEKAMELMGAAEPTSELGRFIKDRDIFLLDIATRKGSD